jgi:hypothetical protein
MSLWYESLAFSLYGCGENPKKRAKCILSYLSMPVPRSWWERALRTGYVDDTHASVLRELMVELSNLADLRGVITSGLLVALAFVQEDSAGSRSHTIKGETTVEDYLIKAEKVLAERPDLAQLGRLIDQKEESPA